MFILPNNQDTITDALLRREVFLQRFASHLVNTDLDGTIQAFAKKIPSLLNELGDANTLTLTERKAITKLVTKEMNDDWILMWEDITGQLDKMAINDMDHVASIFKDIENLALAIPPSAITLGHINNSIMLLTSGKTSQAGVWSKYVRDNIDSATQAVNGAIWNGYTNGLTNNQIAQEVRGKFNRRTKKFEGGILQGRTRAQGDALVRTGTSHFSNQARDRMYKANKDVLSKRILFAVMDVKTSDICISRHLDEWDIDDDTYPRLPFHFNERSIYTITIKGIDEVEGDRPSVGGKIDKSGDLVRNVKIIPADTTWDSFLRRQPRQFIVETLGVKRAALFIDGKMNIDKFTDMTGRTLTLKQLAAKPSLKSAFSSAGL